MSDNWSWFVLLVIYTSHIFYILLPGGLPNSYLGNDLPAGTGEPL